MDGEMKCFARVVMGSAYGLLAGDAPSNKRKTAYRVLSIISFVEKNH